MRIPTLGFLAHLIGVVAACCTSLANADSATPRLVAPETPEAPAFEARNARIELAAGAAFGRVTLPTQESINPYGYTLSARAGWTFLFPAYVGLRAEYGFGSFSDYPIPSAAAVRYHASTAFVGGDIGYEIRLGPGYLRPQLGIGASLLRTSARCESVSDSFGGLGRQVCDADSGTFNSWKPALLAGLPIGLHSRRFYGFVEPAYYVRHAANAYALLAGVGFTL